MQKHYKKACKAIACCFPGFASVGVRGALPHRPAIQIRQDCRTVRGLESTSDALPYCAYGALRGDKPLPALVDPADIQYQSPCQLPILGIFQHGRKPPT